MEVHLVDGTYELFRQYYGQRGRRHEAADGTDVAAVAGVLSSLLTMISEGATHLVVATDQRIESFRNTMWPTYKTSAGVPAELLAQFPILEQAAAALGVLVLAMDELEADDGLASAAAVAAEDEGVERVLIWTPDKDLAQCVVGCRVVQVDRLKRQLVDEEAVVAKFGVEPASIPDWLALVGDSADGFPGLPGWGKKSASLVLARYEHLESVPTDASLLDADLGASLRGATGLLASLSEQFELALLFRDLATLRVEPGIVGSVAEMRWRGPGEDFEKSAEYLRSPRLAERAAGLLV